ncbi:twin-arginine translocase subunit TatB [Brevundimonas goettingensis]|uniref:Sec-independent protein translocase protein TatB n=1 Tax=Brevundimonas goettingensis TaxID=2774190 RepID=A0A975C6B3_9CAUL|nr:Sec-independent protein translocase protein TatB [Brevundimonas goettingensis]QTC93244.1 twin-arginine translocase subunit TatB [Brevundimonas goettingensis]
MGPGIGGSEWFIIGLVALLVVGPERLPGLLRQLGKMVAKARGMANEFRASFDEMARQSELDELRKEVEALRTGQNSPVRLGADADAAFKGIKDEFDKPLFVDTPAVAPVVPETVAEPVMAPSASEWPDGEPVMMPVATPPLAEAEPVPQKTPAKRKAAAKPAAKTSTKAPATKATAAKPAPKAKARAPRNSKLDL